MKKLLVIGRTFPEPSTTAAGGHMMDILDFFQQANYKIILTSTASISEHSARLEEQGISLQNIILNDASFDELLREFQPNVVLFDRFIMEEQFGWRVQEILPQALKILDTEDLHFVRRAREAALKRGEECTAEDLYTEDAKRELASILRCDLSLIISEVEIETLTNQFKIPEDLLMYLPLLAEKQSDDYPGFEEREHFVSVGNFNHAPNRDAVKYLKKEIWPLIRQQLPQAELHIYGAYAPEQIKQIHQPKEGFLVKGWVDDINEVMRNAKVCLAPIRFGAGLKGKLLDAMLNQTPMVTTDIGAEGMYGKYQAPGIIANNTKSIAEAAVELYTKQNIWRSAQTDIPTILSQRFNKKRFNINFLVRLATLRESLTKHRKQHFLAQILHHQSLQSTKYLGKWIEEKNR